MRKIKNRIRAVFLSGVMLMQAAPVVVYDSSLRADKIYEGTIDDVLTYNEAGENASVVVPYTFNGWAREIFVYKYGLGK